VGSNGVIVQKDVPRLVHRTRVFADLPACMWFPPPQKACFDGQHLSAALKSVDDPEERRTLLVSQFVQQLSDLVDVETRNADTSVQQLGNDKDFDLASYFAEFLNNSTPTTESHTSNVGRGNVWAVLQAINQTCVFPAVVALHKRLADNKSTQSPLLDERGANAWTVDVFIRPQPETVHSDSNSRGGSKSNKSLESETAVLVRHKRRMRSSDPNWPFSGLWYLDIHFRYENDDTLEDVDVATPSQAAKDAESEPTQHRGHQKNVSKPSTLRCAFGVSNTSFCAGR